MNNQFILTGPMGSGKSTILDILNQKGISVIKEPARKILSEQRAINGNGVPEKDPKLFCQLMLSRAIDDYSRHSESKTPVIYDRGIPDIKSYADLFHLDLPETKMAAGIFKYHKTIFILPSWKSIYTKDDERKMTFEQASAFGEILKSHYHDVGYQLYELPKESALVRAEIILQYLTLQGGT